MKVIKYCVEQFPCGYKKCGGSIIECGFKGLCDYQRPISIPRTGKQIENKCTQYEYGD